MSAKPKSYSKWGTYDQCPRKYKYRYNDRIPVLHTEKSEAAVRGTRVHDSVEHLFKGERTDVDEEIQDYSEWLCSIKDSYDCIPEMRFALNNEFEACGYTDSDCLVRGFIDLVVKPENAIVAYEWKTGKEYPEHMDQKMLYGMVLLVLFPMVDEVSVTGVYFDQGNNRKIIYKRAMLGTYKWMWLRRFETMDSDSVYAPNPSFLCRWCDYSKDRGGPCSF